MSDIESFVYEETITYEKKYNIEIDSSAMQITIQEIDCNPIQYRPIFNDKDKIYFYQMKPENTHASARLHAILKMLEKISYKLGISMPKIKKMDDMRLLVFKNKSDEAVFLLNYHDSISFHKLPIKRPFVVK
jgi:hypothetical protein